MRKGYFLAVVLVGLGMMSCKKDASKFQGQVRLIDSTGSYLSGPGATITVHPNDTAKASVLTGISNAEGVYLLENVPDGIYVLKAELIVDSTLTYVGVTSKLECTGKDFIAAPIDMSEN